MHTQEPTDAALENADLSKCVVCKQSNYPGGECGIGTFPGAEAIVGPCACPTFMHMGCADRLHQENLLNDKSTKCSKCGKEYIMGPVTFWTRLAWDILLSQSTVIRGNTKQLKENRDFCIVLTIAAFVCFFFSMSALLLFECVNSIFPSDAVWGPRFLHLIISVALGLTFLLGFVIFPACIAFNKRLRKLRKKALVFIRMRCKFVMMHDMEELRKRTEAAVAKAERERLERCIGK